MASTSNPLFDFHDFLNTKDPGQQYIVTPLSGGLVNLTSRATKTSPSIGGCFRDRKSLILKHATPFIASLGPEFPFPVERQITEAAALALFEQDDGPLSFIPSMCNIHIPELLAHDSKSNVIVISDLGDWKDLNSILTPSKDISSSETPLLTSTNASTTGQRLGKFFAKLHSKDVASLVSLTAFPLPKNFKYNRDHEFQTIDGPKVGATKSVVYEVAVKPIYGYLQDYGVRTDDAQQLYSRVKRAFADHNSNLFRGLDHGQLTFTIGDAWTGAILLGPRPRIGSQFVDLEVAVIDWEFAELKKGYGVDTDVAQLIAGMNLHRMQARSCGDDHLSKMIWKMMKTFLQSYSTKRAEDGAWDEGLHDKARTMKKFHVIRASYILFGRELINNAIQREWTCSCCGEKAGGNGTMERCQLKVEMVETGIWYLQIAGEDGDKLWQNWAGTAAKETIFRHVFDYEGGGLWNS